MHVYQVGIIEADHAAGLLGGGIFNYRSGLGAAGDTDDIIRAADRDHNILSRERAMLVIHPDGVRFGDAFTSSQMIGGAIINGVSPADLTTLSGCAFRHWR